MDFVESGNREEPQAEADGLLRAYQECPPQQAEEMLQKLVSQHAEPLIQGVVASKLHGRFTADREDLRNDVVLLLLARLRALRSSAGENQIRHFRNYVAVLSYNACSRYFQRKYPFRQRFKNHLRYILSHDGSFAIWKEQQDLVCGKKEWTAREDLCTRELLEAAGKDFLKARGIREQLKRLFHTLQRPVRLDDLLESFADVWRQDEMNQEVEPSFAPDLEGELSRRTELERTWQEISRLPAKQKIALLFSLRDEQGEGMLLIFPAAGIASARKIADTLEMPAEDLASLWKDLPLDDLRIAGMLGVSRQQVINLRKCARERLSRRLHLV